MEAKAMSAPTATDLNGLGLQAGGTCSSSARCGSARRQVLIAWR